MKILSQKPEKNLTCFYRSGSREHEWAYKQTQSGIGILVLYYSALGGVKIKEILEEYSKIFESGSPFEENLEEFKQYNFQ